MMGMPMRRPPMPGAPRPMGPQMPPGYGDLTARTNGPPPPGWQQHNNVPGIGVNPNTMGPGPTMTQGSYGAMGPGGGMTDAQMHPFAPRNRFPGSMGMGGMGPMGGGGVGVPWMENNGYTGPSGYTGQIQTATAQPPTDAMLHPFAPRNRFAPMAPGSSMRNLLMQGGMRYL